METDFAILRNCVAVLLSSFPTVCGKEPQRLSVSRLREFDHSRRGTSFFRLLWIHDHYSRRNVGGVDCAAAVRRVLLCSSRDIWLCLLRILVLRELSVHRHVHGGCARSGLAS